MPDNSLVAPAQQMSGLSLAVARGAAEWVSPSALLLGASNALALGTGAWVAPTPTMSGSAEHLSIITSQGIMVALPPTLQGAALALVQSGGSLEAPAQTLFGWDLISLQVGIVAPQATVQGTSSTFDPLLPADPVQVRYRCGDPMGTDLSIQVKGSQGPIVPVSISYCLYREISGGQRVQVGPPYRFPVQDRARLGRYYPVGRLDGQPGRWIIRWAIQQNFYYPVQYLEQTFEVQDALMASLQGDQTVRTLKQDWS